MNESLENNFSFDKVSFAHIRELITLVAGSQKRDAAYLRERYDRVAQNFDDTLGFLSGIGLVNESDGILEADLENTNLTEEDVKRAVLQGLFKSSKRSLSEFREYLENFVESEGRYSFQPSLNVNLNTSGLRNLLIQLGFLEQDKMSGGYIVSEVGTPYLNRRQRTLSARNLSTILRNQEQLGTMAEEAVMAYERKVLEFTPELAELIEHVAKNDVGAGYDIRSARPLSGKYEDRYIEVKAVSTEHDFYWSVNEVNTAKALGSKYHLYLVPVLSGGTFDLDNLIIISDPYLRLFERTDSRKLEPVSFHVSPTASFLKEVQPKPNS
jgi:hypothetical protein